ncbi:MAG: hypothetical protein LJF15_14340 [Acidobacteria bacterium]|nr:hypothetical protein [Acidobacteriota bacterium]
MDRRWWLVALMICAPPTAGMEARANGMPDSRTETAIGLMTGFADRTGLTSPRPQQRYLWTDAFAVCNLLGLARATGDERYQELALRLVERVHQVLGRHRSDDLRTGWISGLDERAGEEHPTRGGLRIGKPLPERGPDDTFDERLEWDRDGQYFHYLTKWMQALDLVARATHQPRFNLWARELAATAHAAFTYAPPGGRSRMYWKMSIDLSRPLVPSMGQHDPLDGFVTCVQLQVTARNLSRSPEGPGLGDEVADFRSMMKGRDWATADPLGLGGLLMDASRVEQLMRRGAFGEDDLLEELLGAALVGLEHYARQGELDRPATMRLAFRELGLAIGLQAVERMRKAAEERQVSPEVRSRLEDLMRHASLREKIEGFWLDAEHQRAPTWTEHRDINEVMLATSLVPEGCLELPPID